MAIVSITFDTKEKTLAATVDGKKVDNVSEVNIFRSYNDDDEYSCGLTTAVKDEENDSMHMTRMYACDSSDGKRVKATASENKDFPDFLNVPVQTKAQADIESFFKKD